jgi:elongation factor Ts
MITPQDVMALREKTGAGMMDCKRALNDAAGDADKAIDLLRERGMASVAKKAGRIAAEGVVGSYIHMGGQIGVLIEVNCETDFVAKTDEFHAFVKDMAMQVVASKPTFIAPEEVPAGETEHEKEILRAQALSEGKPEKIVDKMVEGRIQKYFKEVCLLEQPFIRDPEKAVKDVLGELSAKIGEKISVRRFVRYEMGEGLEKRKDDLAEEVGKQLGK